MNLAITSFSAGFHAQENVTPVFKDVGGYFVQWHQLPKLPEALVVPSGFDSGLDAIYCIGWYV